MADRHRPPMATIEGGWDAPGRPAPAAPPPPPKQPALPSQREAPEDIADDDRTVVDPPHELRQGDPATPDSANGADPETITLPGTDLDALVGEASSDETPLLDPAAVDRLLSAPRGTPRAPSVDGAPLPPVQRLHVEDPASPPPAPTPGARSAFASVPPPALGLRGSMPSFPPEGLAGAVAPPHDRSWPSVPPPAPVVRPPTVTLRRGLIAIGAGCGVAFLALSAWLLARPKERPGVGIVLSAGSPTAVSSGTGDPTSSAHAALERFREGLRICVQNQIGVLPGTSPAVPASAQLLRNGPYSSTPSDWRTPVWACTKFQLNEPQAFQIQWQQTKTNVEGMAVVWIDDNHDGKPDRAFGFHAMLKKRGEIEIGDITPLDPARVEVAPVGHAPTAPPR